MSRLWSHYTAHTRNHSTGYGTVSDGLCEIVAGFFTVNLVEEVGVDLWDIPSVRHFNIHLADNFFAGLFTVNLVEEVGVNLWDIPSVGHFNINLAGNFLAAAIA